MPTDESRSAKRKERYRELRALGFTVEEARKLRDYSGQNINSSIEREQRRISRKPVQLRTAQESFRLRRIQDRNKYQTEVQKKARMESRRERWEQFAEWSKSNIWPDEIRKRVRQINRRAGLPGDDGYGYRRFYYEYVERLDIDEASDLADRGDSGMRWLLNKSLVRGRVNLRRLINPPKSRSERAS